MIKNLFKILVIASILARLIYALEKNVLLDAKDNKILFGVELPQWGALIILVIAGGTFDFLQFLSLKTAAGAIALEIALLVCVNLSVHVAACFIKGATCAIIGELIRGEDTIPDFNRPFPNFQNVNPSNSDMDRSLNSRREGLRRTHEIDRDSVRQRNRRQNRSRSPFISADKIVFNATPHELNRFLFNNAPPSPPVPTNDEHIPGNARLRQQDNQPVLD